MKFVFVVLLFVASVIAANAQTVYNPNSAQWTPAADEAFVDHYDITVFSMNNTGVLVFSGQLCSITSSTCGTVASGNRTVPLPTAIKNLAKNTVYAAYISAVNSAGSGKSNNSNPFAFLDVPSAPLNFVIK